jgi:hypothetical protein
MTAQHATAQTEYTKHPAPDLLEQFLQLAGDAQDRLPFDILGDRGYTLGQRNTYARAASHVAAQDSHEDPALIADRIVHALAEGTTDMNSLREVALAGVPRPAGPHALDWIGPKTFEARYGDVPGIDHDYGMRWGARNNQRISLRHGTDTSEGLLYAYDRTWDEYAVLQHRISTVAVSQVFREALRRDEHLPVEDFARLIEVHLAHRAPVTTLSVEL